MTSQQVSGDSRRETTSVSQSKITVPFLPYFSVEHFAYKTPFCYLILLLTVCRWLTKCINKLTEIRKCIRYKKRKARQDFY